MKRLTLTLVTSSLAATLALVVLLVAVPVEQADACFQCTCDTARHTTPSRTVGGSTWTGGSSCDLARSQLLFQLQSLATCEICSYTLVITEDCMMDDPMWYPVTGYLQYYCWP